MDTVLLATKTRVPPSTHRLLPRARLVDALEQDIPEYKLILISAPAGYGKTTLLAEWARSTRYPVAWVSPGEDDNDLERLLRYMLAAWELVEPDIRESPFGLLLEGVEPDIDAVLRAFVNAGNDVSEHTVFVLDDCQRLDDPAIHRALTFLVDNLPPALHVVLAGRSDLPLPLARYRARQDVLELRADDLQFAEEESGAFLNQLMGLDLDDTEIERVQGQLEGWVAGLQLAGLAHRRLHSRSEPLALRGTSRYIADYLSEEVLAGLDDEHRRFLLQTSILDSLCGELCDAVTGGETGQETLEFLERANLFLAPLDDRRHWFRYHRVFADFLQQELARQLPQDVNELHRRATGWFLRHDLPDQAFHHAVAANDPDLAEHVGDRYVYGKLSIGEVMVVKRWLDSIPDAWFESHPMFGVARTGMLIFSGQYETGLHCLDDVEHVARASNTDQRRVLARVTAIRCLIACVQNDLLNAEHFAGLALRQLPEDDYDFRAGIHGALGDTYRASGRWEEAREWYLKTLQFTRSSVARIQFANVFGALADLDLRQGHLREAAGNWSKALGIMQEGARFGYYPLPAIGWVYLRMAELFYEWNHMERARDHLSQGLERAELGGDVRALIAGYLTAGRIALGEGNVALADDYLERTGALVSEAPFPDWTSHVERFQVEVWLAQDRLRAVVDWSDGMRQGAWADRPEPEIAQLTLARVQIVKGDAPSREQALALLREVRERARDEGRGGLEVEALALRSLAEWGIGDRPGAMVSLEEALRLAEPEGYVRLFIDLGLPMLRILQEARARGVMADYVTALLQAAGDHGGTGRDGERALPEPLSDRELDVLKLLAAGLTNREIADALTISPQTVKTHAENIYGKLGVRGRMEAATRARELDLLG
jgi:LuxR family maltose regulon positive regulatory protein